MKTRYEQIKAATHLYIGRVQPCGCVVALVNDTGDKFTAKAVSEFIADGLAVERISFERYREEIVHEPGFMGCPHGQLKLELTEVDDVTLAPQGSAA